MRIVWCPEHFMFSRLLLQDLQSELQAHSQKPKLLL
jgi:hypothetical protein